MCDTSHLAGQRNYRRISGRTHRNHQFDMKARLVEITEYEYPYCEVRLGGRLRGYLRVAPNGQYLISVNPHIRGNVMRSYKTQEQAVKAILNTRPRLTTPRIPFQKFRQVEKR